MKKYKHFKSIALLFILLIALFQIYINLISSSTSHYTTVEDLIEYNGNSRFIDIYDPEAYYDLTKEMRTISQINRIDIYYNGSSKEGYNISFDVDKYKNEKMEINIAIDFDKNAVNMDIKNLELLKFDFCDVYIDVDSSLIIGIMDDYEVCIKFISNNKNKLDKEDKKIGVKMIKDIYYLNKN